MAFRAGDRHPDDGCECHGCEWRGCGAGAAWHGHLAQRPSVRPKVVFGVTGHPAPVLGARNRRGPHYIIETDDLRLKENTTADARRIDATVGEPVTFALEKNTVYIEAEGAEHKLGVSKKITKTGPDSTSLLGGVAIRYALNLDVLKPRHSRWHEQNIARQRLLDALDRASDMSSEFGFRLASISSPPVPPSRCLP
jgi:hypothetical protein